MCGVVGGVAFRNTDLESRILTGIENLKHRGPDDHGLFIIDRLNYSVALAHRRLSIIDLSKDGHQPMSSVNNRYTLTFNGEIYNYKELRNELKSLGYVFSSETDTEVLLNCWSEWGKDCIERLEGMFSFVIYDNQKCSVFLVRDAFGIKPLYYTHNKNSLYFSSELPTLYKLVPTKLSLNKSSVINYLSRSEYDHGVYTLTNELSAVEPGTFIEIQINEDLELKKYTWWDPLIEENKKISFEEATLKLRSLFLESVELHLQSDVPIGAALSGGIDSSSIVCAIRFLRPSMPIHTFSYVARNTSANEEYWIDLVNDYIEAVPHKIITDLDDLKKELPNLLTAQGEPFGSTSIFAQFCVFREAHKNGIKVVLEGQGADELLGGYDGYPKFVIWSLFDQYKFFGMLKFIFKWKKFHKKSIKFLFEFLKNLTLEKLKSKFSFLRLLEKSKNSHLSVNTPTWINDNKPLLQAASLQLRKEDLYENQSKNRRLIYELRRSVQSRTGGGLSSLLRHGDRNSMWWSIESRVPFLSKKIAEFVFSLPEEFIVSNGGRTKHIFREAMRGIVPDEILDRADKIGFETPEQNWIERLDFCSFDGLDYFDFLNENLIGEVDQILKREKPFNWLPWRVFNLIKWLKMNLKYIESHSD